MAVVKVDARRITDWDSFHGVFAEVFGFPDFYGRNMNAWIDCLTSLDEPDHGMTKVHAPPGGVLVLQLDNVGDFARRCPELYEAVIECAAFVNWRKIPAVTEAAVFPERLELLSDGQRVVIHFLDIAQWHRGGWLYRPLARLGFRVRGWPSVADRDWFHPPAGRFFRFYTSPPIAVYMPDEPRNLGYGETMFRRIQHVIGLGGFGTYDLG